MKKISIFIIVSIIIIIIIIIISFQTNFIVDSISIENNRFKDIGKNSLNIQFEKFNVSELKTGDIAFKHPDAFPDFFPTIIDHCLLFIGYNELTGEYSFIEASIMGSKVKYTNVSKALITEECWGPFGRVKTANSTQIENAIDFVKTQLGKRFQNEWTNKNYNPEDTKNDSLADKWYCSELIWAAYFNCNNNFPKDKPTEGYIYGEGIDLDWNGGSIVRPKEIKNNIKHVKIFYLDNNATYNKETKNDSNYKLSNFFKSDFIFHKEIIRALNK